jgi:hypothetical protein
MYGERYARHTSLGRAGRDGQSSPAGDDQQNSQHREDEMTAGSDPVVQQEEEEATTSNPPEPQSMEYNTPGTGSGLSSVQLTDATDR